MPTALATPGLLSTCRRSTRARKPGRRCGSTGSQSAPNTSCAMSPACGHKQTSGQVGALQRASSTHLAVAERAELQARQQHELCGAQGHVDAQRQAPSDGGDEQEVNAGPCLAVSAGGEGPVSKPLASQAAHGRCGVQRRLARRIGRIPGAGDAPSTRAPEKRRAVLDRRGSLAAISPCLTPPARGAAGKMMRSRRSRESAGVRHRR